MKVDNLAEILDQLLRQPHESVTVEFKSNLEEPKEIGEYISALGNSAALDKHDLAWIVWGVDNNTHAIKGTKFDPFKKKAKGNQALIMWLTYQIEPRPDFQFHLLSHPDGRVVMLAIHPPKSSPLAFQGVRYIRIDSNKSNLSKYPDKEARLWESLRKKEDWTGQIVPEASINDLDSEAISFARAKIIEYRIRSENDPARHIEIRNEINKWDTKTLLNKAHITKQGRITRAALILLGKEESLHFLSPADTKISWILRDSNNSTIASQHFGLPLLLSTEKIFHKIRNIQLEYMPDGTLFPTPVSQYDSWVIREALHNCIAHQDYALGGKINVVEFPDKLVLTNLGSFIPPSVQWMLEHESPPEYYRNRCLVEAMINLRMIDQIGSGIRRMFETQRKRFFPLPDYDTKTRPGDKPGVEVSITGRILDMKYTQALMKRADLTLEDVFLLDKVQKHIKLDSQSARLLKDKKLIEGRAPNFYVSSQVAEWTDQKASYIRNRSLDNNFFRKLILEYLQQYEYATRNDLHDLLEPKFSDVLTSTQKQKKVGNLIQSLRVSNQIKNIGTDNAPKWVLCA